MSASNNGTAWLRAGWSFTFIEKEGTTNPHQKQPTFIWIFTAIIVLIIIYNFGVYILIFLAVCGAFLLADQYHKERRRNKHDRDRWH